MKKKDIIKCGITVAAVCAVATGGIFTALHLTADSGFWADTPTPDTPEAQAAAAQILQDKCAACHGENATYNPVLNALSFGLLQRDVEGAQRSYSLTPDAGVRSAAVDFQKIDRVLRERHMPPMAYRLMHPGSALSWRDASVLRGVYNAEDAFKARFAVIEPAAPPADETEADLIRLGSLLYNDTRLSTTNEVACATCHDLTKGGTDNLPKSEGVPGTDGKPQLGGVNAPTVFNAETNIRQFWDGRAADLKEQAGGPPLNPVEMGYAHPEDWNDIAAKLQNDPELVRLFALVFGERGITGDTITEAIAAYEKTLRTPGSAFDRFLQGDATSMTDEQIRGLECFETYGCATCHSGATLGGGSFEYINTFADLRAQAAPADYNEGNFGLQDFTKNPAHKDMFRVPNLRNVALTSPYFHTGSVEKLDDAVRIMLSTQYNGSKGKATEEDVQCITRFLEAQTGTLYGKPLDALIPQDVMP